MSFYLARTFIAWSWGSWVIDLIVFIIYLRVLFLLQEKLRLQY